MGMNDTPPGERGQRWTEITVTYDYYAHRIYAPGTKVYVSEEIRRRNPESPAAGRACIACWGIFAVSSTEPQMQAFLDDDERERPYSFFVPVLVDGKVRQVPEEYVQEARA